MSQTDSVFSHLTLRQLTELEYILIGDLRDVLEEESTQENRKWLVAIVDALLKTLPREFELRSQGGYMQEIVMISPRWNSCVQHLLTEQLELCDQLQILSDGLHAPEVFLQQAASLKHKLMNWLECLQKHNRLEEELVQQAYQTELGCGD